MYGGRVKEVGAGGPEMMLVGIIKLSKMDLEFSNAFYNSGIINHTPHRQVTLL